ncbi:MAG: heparinase II/III family protein [Tepidisphaeraceae bacterium]
MSNDTGFRPIEMLESRLLCSRTPADPRPDTLGKAFDLSERADLFNRLGNLPNHTYLVLRNYLRAGNIGAFDAGLLDYMRNRSSVINYFFKPSDAQSIADYVKAHIGVSGQESHANAVTDDRLFPEASSVSSYTVQLGDSINWNDATKSSNPEFINALNRQDWWVDLAQSYLYTHNTKYSDELAYELASYQQQNPTFTLPAKTTAYTSYGFDVSLRVDNWLMSYFSLLGSSVFTGAENSLFLYKFMQQGDVLSTVSSHISDYTSNRTIDIGKSEMFLGDVFPEFNTRKAWQAQGRAVLFNSIDGQLYADGSQREQSPGYAITVVDDVLEARQLEKLNAIDWPSDKQTQLENAVNAIWQELSPNGLRPAIGDTYRLNGTTLFLKAATVLGMNQWPDNAPSTRDAYVLGVNAISPNIGVSGIPALGNRGANYSLPDSGNYILRSGNDSSARQINFLAGPKGGVHGHYDYMGFELSAYGRPLISDPGVYQYDSSSTRNWIVSAAAHNTIAVTGVNPGDLEDNSDITTSGITSVAGGSMISASYNGYSFLSGNPTLSRSIWYDGNNTMVIVDFASSSEALSYETGVTLPTRSTTYNQSAGLIYTDYASGGNVRVQSLLLPGQTASAATTGVYVSNNPPPNNKENATRYQANVTKSTFAVFATVITTYNGSAASETNNVTWQRVPTKAGQSAILVVNGQSITFPGSAFNQVGKNGAVRGTFNDIAYDSKGRLHEVFYDRDANNLKYAVRGTNGVWSAISTIDPGAYCGYNPSLVIDANDRPAVAYQDAMNGDLKYAYLSPITNAWQVETADVKGSTGGYPSLVMTRHNTAAIAYYNKTNGDLRLATQGSSGWIISTIDSKGDVGRFPSLQLDPNRPTASKFAIAYEDTTHGSFKYALQSNSSYVYQSIDNTTTIGGGYISMKFYKSGSVYNPAVSYYDAGKGQLRYAYSNGKTWTHAIVASRKRQGLYSKLDIDGSTPRIFFFDGTNNAEYLLTGSNIVGSKWTLGLLGDGGREVHYAKYNGRFAFTSLDESLGLLNTY